MRDRIRASQIRQEISQLILKRQGIERSLLRRRRMISACLIRRNLGTTAKKRRSLAYYLSGRVSGKTILRYVRKGDLGRIKRETSAWQDYSNSVARWRKISDEIERLFRELGRVQSEEPFKEEVSDG
jgi:hypothetical protein